jgi:dihydropteroate synthase
MGPVLRISRGGALAITLSGLTVGQTEVLQHIVALSSRTGTGAAPVPVLFSLSADSGAWVLTGTSDQLKRLALLVRGDARVPPGLSEQFDSLLDNYLRSDYKIDCRGKILDLGLRTHIMGVLNVTPDSFSDGGRYVDPGQALLHAREMAAAGADIIDIGGESTRPGALPLTEEEELRRIIPLIERLSGELAVPLSVDTYKSAVAGKALKVGAAIVNDISGLRFSPDMARVVADHGAAVVIMHIKGTPRDMRQDPVYDDVVGEIIAYLEEGIEIAEKAGVDREKTLIDPGIGFGKTLGHNLAILERLDEFRALGRPIVLGTSRKRFIGTVLDIPAPEQRVFGTASTVALGIERGARVLRVHDVAQMAQVARMTDAIIKSR